MLAGARLVFAKQANLKMRRDSAAPESMPQLRCPAHFLEPDSREEKHLSGQKHVGVFPAPAQLAVVGVVPDGLPELAMLDCEALDTIPLLDFMMPTAACTGGLRAIGIMQGAGLGDRWPLRVMPLPVFPPNLSG